MRWALAAAQGCPCPQRAAEAQQTQQTALSFSRDTGTDVCVAGPPCRSTGDKVNVLTMDTRTAAGRTAAAAGLLGLLAAGADREELEHVREVRDAATLDRGLEDVFTGKAVHGKGKASGLNPAAVLVAFYHPQCLHCVHMLEQLDGVAKTLREQHGVKTFAVDCAELGDACARAGVVEMPDLRLYYRPKDDETCAEGAQPEEDAEEGATRTPPFVRYYTPDFDERDALEEKWLELCRKLVNHLALQENLHEMAAMKGFGNVGWTSDDILAFARRVIVAAGVAEIPFLRRPKGGGSAQMTLAQLRQAQAEGEAKATAKPTKVEYCRLGELDAHERVVSGAWRSALEADGAVAEATGAVSKGRRQGKGSGTPYQGRLDLSTAASAIGGSPQEIVVINWRSAPCRILWIDFQGKEKFYFTLLPGQTRQSTSFVGHVWVARDPASGEVLEAWTIEDKTEGEAEEVQLLAIYPADDEEPVS